MAVTKTFRTIAAGVTVGVSATVDGTEVDLASALGGTLLVRVTNGSAAPTAGCSAAVIVRESGAGTYRVMASQTAGLVADGVYDFTFDVPPGVMRANVRFSGVTGNAVTGDAYLHELTTV